MCIYGRVQARSGGLMDGTSRLRRGDEELHHSRRVVLCRVRRGVAGWFSCHYLQASPAAIAAIAGCAVVTGVGAVVNVAAGQGAVAGRSLLVMGAGEAWGCRR